MSEAEDLQKAEAEVKQIFTELIVEPKKRKQI